MKRFALMTIGAALALSLPVLGWAQQRDLEVTMDVVPANAAPAAATGEIKLPDSASDRARDASAFGLGVANRAREMRGELGRDFGKEVSETARERGKPPFVPGKP